ncbi:hypothetical protein RIF29_24836 [Crotalaria pallida]|uniref:Uncharacterized protein n=1 Tax=Crotalaria pallida TaxID=3830 RepID=A0AAN9EMQ2_CROPI
MGNKASCSSSCSCISDSVSVSKGFSNKCGSTAVVLDTNGNIREMKLPMKSGELMIEEIGHVITEVDELRKTRRITALRADEELVAGKVYLLVPVSRTRSKASEFEMAIAENYWRFENGNGQRKKMRESMVKVLRDGREGENGVSNFNMELRFSSFTPPPSSANYLHLNHGRHHHCSRSRYGQNCYRGTKRFGFVSRGGDDDSDSRMEKIASLRSQACRGRFQDLDSVRCIDSHRIL